MKIDLVYLWVDGNDAALQKKRDAALCRLGQCVPAHSKAAARFQDNDELRYSLRSVEKFAPWINHIYIVTDNQRPAWLADNKRVTIVDHRDFIPRELLPTFSSNMIELLIYRIPKLSEHFLLANDDFFFGRDVTPDFFFDKNGNPIVTMGEKNWPAGYYTGEKAAPRLVLQTTANALKYAYDKTGIKFKWRLKHAFEPMRKSYMRENVESDFALFQKTTFLPFRAASQIQRIFLPFLDNAKGRNTIVDSLGGACFDKTRRRFLSKIAPPWLGKREPHRNKNIDRLISWRHFKNMPYTFCINSTWWLNSFRANLPAMQKLFPEKSGFEK